MAYAGEYYSAGRAARFRWPIAESVMRWFRGRRARQLERAIGGVSGKRILDVGCGRGFTLRRLQERGADVYGTQMSESAANAARALIGDERVFVGELADARFPAGAFDAVTLWHVLEHVPAPLDLLREIARLLREGGVAYIETPNAGGWTARTFAADWLAYDIEHHVSHFTPESLTALAGRAGLEPTRVQHLSIEYSPVTLMQTWLNRVLGGNNRLFRAVTFGGDDGTNGSVPLAVHAIVGALLFPCAIVASVWLAARRNGDTYGVWLCKRVKRVVTRV